MVVHIPPWLLPLGFVMENPSKSLFPSHVDGENSLTCLWVPRRDTRPGQSGLWPCEHRGTLGLTSQPQAEPVLRLLLLQVFVFLPLHDAAGSGLSSGEAPCGASHTRKVVGQVRPDSQLATWSRRAASLGPGCGAVRLFNAAASGPRCCSVP